MASKDLRFCPSCSNMLYLREKLNRLSSSSRIQLQEFCRRCGFEAEPETPDITESGNIIVYERVLKGETLTPEIDQNVFEDPAIPTTREIRCPNDTCLSNTASDTNEPRAKFIVTDYNAIKIAYRCIYCGTTWRNN